MSKVGTSVQLEAETSPMLCVIVRVTNPEIKVPDLIQLGQFADAKMGMLVPTALSALETNDDVLSVGLYPRELFNRESL